MTTPADPGTLTFCKGAVGLEAFVTDWEPVPDPYDDHGRLLDVESVAFSLHYDGEWILGSATLHGKWLPQAGHPGARRGSIPFHGPRLAVDDALEPAPARLVTRVNTLLAGLHALTGPDPTQGSPG